MSGECPPRMLRFDAFGYLIGIERVAGRWRAYYLGAEGKRRDAGVVIPDDLPESELARFLADLFHEAATPERPDVVPIVKSGPAV